MKTLKIKKTLFILLFFIPIISCHSGKKPDDILDIQERFQIKGNVKEIQKKIETEDFYYFSITTFDRVGNPIKTTQYDKTGEEKNIDSWVGEKATPEELEQIKTKNEYDSKHRLIKHIEYYDEAMSFEIEYKYSTAGKKSEEIKKFGDRKIQSLYDINGYLKEVITSILEDDKFYWQSKEKYIYNKNNVLIEKYVYNFPDESNISGKYLYQYDSIGSLIRISTYYSGSKIPEIENRKIIYY